MKIQNKIEIEFNEKDIQHLLHENLIKLYGEGEYSFKFVVINKPKPHPIYLSDTIDNHVFDRVRVVIVS